MKTFYKFHSGFKSNEIPDLQGAKYISNLGVVVDRLNSEIFSINGISIEFDDLSDIINNTDNINIIGYSKVNLEKTIDVNNLLEKLKSKSMYFSAPIFGNLIINNNENDEIVNLNAENIESTYIGQNNQPYINSDKIQSNTLLEDTIAIESNKFYEKNNKTSVLYTPDYKKYNIIANEFDETSQDVSYFGFGLPGINGLEFDETGISESVELRAGNSTLIIINGELVENDDIDSYLNNIGG